MILNKRTHSAEFAAALRIVRAALPAYRKHSILLTLTDSVQLTGRYWSGGSRSVYIGLRFEPPSSAAGFGAAEGRWRPARQFPSIAPAPFGPGGDDETVPLTATYCVVETGTFCGKESTAHLFITLTAACAAGIKTRSSRNNMNTWNDDDAAAALAAGWLLAYIDTDDGRIRHEIQRYDCAPRATLFSSDDDALLYVRLRAVKGHALEQRALAYIKEHNDNA